MKTILLLCLALAWLPCFAQPPGVNVRAVDYPDGSAVIVGENHTPMPVTIVLRARLRDMSSSSPLPARVVLEPSQPAALLVRFTPLPAGHCSYEYSFTYMLGRYTGHLPDTTYVYGLPFQLSENEILPLRADQQNIYRFLLPDNTPVCAAREGVVAFVKQRVKNSPIMNGNLLYVAHQDGSYACYENISPNSVVVQVGQRVAKGDMLSSFGGNKRVRPFFFSVEYPTDSTTATAPVVFQIGDRRVRPR